MNLYRTTGMLDDEKNTRWSGAQAEASKDRVAMKKSGAKNVATEEVDVPTKKQELIEFLNGL